MPDWRREVLARLGDGPLPRGRTRDEIVDEICAHLETSYDERRAAGAGDEEARRAALADLAGPAVLGEALAELSRPPAVPRAGLWEESITSTRLALRRLRHHRLFALAFAGTLALGIATGTATLAIVKQALLAPLPYPDDASLVSLLTESHGHTTAVSAHVFRDLREAGAPFASYAAVRPGGATFQSAQSTERVLTNIVTAGYFELLGATPILGRVWTGNESAVAVVSERFWNRALGASPRAVGQSISLDGRLHMVTGVLRADFLPPYWAEAEIWTPLDLRPLVDGANRGRRPLTLLARRAKNASQADADAFLEVFSGRMRAEHPAVHEGQRWIARPLREELVGSTRVALVGLAQAAVLLLLAVCSTIAALSAARSAGDAHQRAVCAALGASRGRLLRERVIESLLLGAAGSAAGVWVGAVLVRFAATAQEAFLARLPTLALDGPTAGQAFVVGVVAASAASVAADRVPAGLADDLRKARGSSGGRALARSQAVLVALQVAVAVVLAVGAGLVARTVLHLGALPLGFRSEGLTTFSVGLAGTRYDEAAEQIAFEHAVLERLERLPGVVATSASVGIPIVGNAFASMFIFGRDAQPAEEVHYFSVSPSFVPTFGVRLVAGRNLEATDSIDAPRVALVNETLARRFFPAGDALGARIDVGAGSRSGTWITIVGIVADVRQHGPLEEVMPTVFGSTRQFSWPRRHFTVRTDAETPALAPLVRTAVREIDPALAVGSTSSLDALVEERTAVHRLVMSTFVLFGGAAALLCAFGLYGVAALTSAMRRREYAIRLALGAMRRGVQWLAVRQAAGLAAAGGAAGIAVALLGTRALEGLLHGVTPLDPSVFALTVLFILTTALVACWLPARRAGRVDPIEALRAE